MSLIHFNCGRPMKIWLVIANIILLCEKSRQVSTQQIILFKYLHCSIRARLNTVRCRSHLDFWICVRICWLAMWLQVQLGILSLTKGPSLSAGSITMATYAAALTWASDRIMVCSSSAKYAALDRSMFWIPLISRLKKPGSMNKLSIV